MPNTKQAIEKKGHFDKRFFMFFIPSFILVLILLFQVTYSVCSIVITQRIYESILIATDETTSHEIISIETINLIKEFINSYDNQFLTLGLEIVGIAISVWIGLNIYNIVKRDSLKNLEETSKRTQKDLKDFSDNYRQFNITAIRNACIAEDRISHYFISEFMSINSEVLDYKLTKTIVFFEKSLENIILNYNSKNFGQMEVHLSKYWEEIKSFKEDIIAKKNNIDNSSKCLIDAYIECRTADYYYYTGLRFIARKENESAKENLIKARDHYSKIKQEIDVSESVVNTYIYNVKSYIYQLLFINSKNKSECVKYAEKAYEYSKKACSDSELTPYETGYSRDHRNYGVNIENYLKSFKFKKKEHLNYLSNAYAQYKIAYKFDNRDMKTLISLVSCALKILDREFNVTNNFENCKRIENIVIPKSNKKFKELSFNFTTEQLIREASHYLTIAKQIDNSDLSLHYHSIHLNMYKYLFNEKKEIYLTRGLKDIEICEDCLLYSKEKCLPFLYKAKNFCFVIGEKEKMDKYKKLIDN